MLVIGASGFLGQKIVTILSPELQVIPSYDKNAPENAEVRMDICNPLSVKTLHRVKPDMIISTVGSSNAFYCEKEPKKSWKLNVQCLYHIVNYCKITNIKLIWFSHSYVFEGRDTIYNIDSERNPVNVLGKNKKEAEDIITSTLKNYAIIRCDVLYGYNGPKDRETLPSEIIKKLNGDHYVFSDSRRKRYPVLIDDVAELVLKIAKKNVEDKQIIHAVSVTPITNYEWAKLVCRIFDLNPTFLLPVVEAANTIKACPYPDNPHLMPSIEIEPFRTLRQGLELMKEQMNYKT